MLRYLYAVLIGIVGAAILHLAIIFLLPSQSENNTWKFVSEISEPYETVLITDDLLDEDLTLSLDPLFKMAICRYNLSDGAVRITADGNTLYWSLSAYNKNGTIFFSANNRISNENRIDLAIVNEQQLRYARQNTPDEISEALLASTKDDDGFVIVRVFIPDESWSQASNDFLTQLSCEPLEFE